VSCDGATELEGEERGREEEAILLILIYEVFLFLFFLVTVFVKK
jgi:hypothetical protein